MPQLAGFLELDVTFKLATGSGVAVGQQLKLAAGSSKLRFAELRDGFDGTAHCIAPASPPGGGKQPATKLQAVVELVKRRLIECPVLVTHVSADGGSAAVLLAVVLCNATWSVGAHRWPAGDRAALLFQHLLPPRAAAPAGGACQPLPQLSYVEGLRQELAGQGVQVPEGFSLAECLRALPRKLCQEAAATILPADGSRPCLLAELPGSVVLQILGCLDWRSLAAAAAACRGLRELSADVAPGLKLTLFPHQRAAVQWMQQRETAAGRVPHPTIRSFLCLELGPHDDPFTAAPERFAAAARSAGPNTPPAPLAAGLPFWGDTGTGQLLVEEPEPLLDSPGGFNCDEPGLGKTIELLALVLRTVRKLPAPPPGARVTEVEPGVRHFYVAQEPRCFAMQPAVGDRSDRATRDSCKRTRGSAGELLQADDDDPVRTERVNRRQRRSPSEQPQLEQQQQQRGFGGVGTGGAEKEEQQQDRLPLVPPPQQQASRVEEQPAGAQLGCPSAGPAGPELPSAPSNVWASCDLCNKWRRLPSCYEVPSEGLWVCAMHPEEGMRWQGCQAPQEAWDGAVVRACPGWVESEDDQGSPQNVQFFRRLLEEACSLAHKNSPLAWLARQPLEPLMRSPFRLQGDMCRYYPEFVTVFHRMDLEPVPMQRQQRQPPGRMGGKGGAHLGRRGSGMAAKRASVVGGRGNSSSGSDDEDEWSSLTDDSDQDEAGEDEAVQAAAAGTRTKRGRPSAEQLPTVWRRPASHECLLLDLAALRQALLEGPLPPQRIVYLSSATLVAVPQPEHVRHWQYQIGQHAPSLRVLVYTTEEKREAARLGRELTPQRLAWEADVVLTTFQMLSNEDRDPSSPLMQVHWLRKVLDEGHGIGGSDLTNKHRMASQLRAGSAWIMTGTPTRHTLTDASVEELRPQLAFLRQEPACREQWWRKAIQEPFQSGQEVGKLRLLALQHRLMVRAFKDELVGLGIPPLRVAPPTLLDFSPAHAGSYNSFVDIIRFNLLTADWLDPDNNESLLNSKNSKRASQTLENLRRSCNVAGNCALQVLEADVLETLCLLTRVHLKRRCQAAAPPGPSPGAGGSAAKVEERGQEDDPSVPLAQLLEAAGPEWGVRARHLRACLEEGGACERCAGVVRVLLVAPCACLLCVDCAALERERCPCCSSPYVMQGVDHPERRRDNPNPKWAVPVQLIEFQPAYAQRGAKGVEEGTWQADWQHTQSTKCVHLLGRLREVGAAARRGSGSHPTAKAIVYTQFWDHLQVIERYLHSHGVGLAVLKRNGKPAERQAALRRFRNLRSVGVLLMDQTGQVGLDLSFVSHVFLMEPVPDLSEEDQVISRAYRMGAKLAVHVETLAMRGTVEEDIVRQRQQAQQAQHAQQADSTGAPRGGRGAAAGQRERGRLDRRNVLFLALRKVPVRDLPQFEDLPDVPGEAGAAAADGHPLQQARQPLQAQQAQQAQQARGAQQAQQAQRAGPSRPLVPQREAPLQEAQLAVRAVCPTADPSQQVQTQQQHPKPRLVRFAAHAEGDEAGREQQHQSRQAGLSLPPAAAPAARVKQESAADLPPPQQQQQQLQEHCSAAGSGAPTAAAHRSAASTGATSAAAAQPRPLKQLLRSVLGQAGSTAVACQQEPPPIQQEPERPAAEGVKASVQHVEQGLEQKQQDPQNAAHQPQLPRAAPTPTVDDAAAAASPAIDAQPVAAAALCADRAPGPGSVGAKTPPGSAPLPGEQLEQQQDLFDLLYDMSRQGGAAAAGLSDGLVGAFEGVFFSMAPAEQQRRERSLRGSLSRGRLAAVAGHLRAYLRSQGLLEGGGAAAAAAPLGGSCGQGSSVG